MIPKIWFLKKEISQIVFVFGLLAVTTADLTLDTKIEYCYNMVFFLKRALHLGQQYWIFSLL